MIINGRNHSAIAYYSLRSSIKEASPYKLKTALSSNAGLMKAILSDPQKSRSITELVCDVIRKSNNPEDKKKICKALIDSIQTKSPTATEFVREITETFATSETMRHFKKEGKERAIEYFADSASLLGKKTSAKLAKQLFSESERTKLGLCIEFKNLVIEENGLTNRALTQRLIKISPQIGERLSFLLADKHLDSGATLDLIDHFDIQSHMELVADIFDRHRY